MNLKQGKRPSRHREETKQYTNDGKEERHGGLKQCEDRGGLLRGRGGLSGERCKTLAEPNRESKLHTAWFIGTMGGCTPTMEGQYKRIPQLP